MVVSYNLTVGAAAVRLSDSYGDGPGVVNAAHDLPMRQIILQAGAADIVVGGPGVTTTVYGMLLAFTAPAGPVVLGPFDSGPLRLSDLYAISAGSGTLHILAVPY